MTTPPFAAAFDGLCPCAVAARRTDDGNIQVARNSEYILSVAMKHYVWQTLVSKDPILVTQYELHLP